MKPTNPSDFPCSSSPVHHPPPTPSSPRRPRRHHSSSPGATPPLHGPRVSAPPHRSLALYSPSHSTARPFLRFRCLPAPPGSPRRAVSLDSGVLLGRLPARLSSVWMRSHCLLPGRGCFAARGCAELVVFFGREWLVRFSGSFLHMSLRSPLGHYGIRACCPLLFLEEMFRVVTI